MKKGWKWLLWIGLGLVIVFYFLFKKGQSLLASSISEKATGTLGDISKTVATGIKGLGTAIASGAATVGTKAGAVTGATVTAGGAAAGVKASAVSLAGLGVIIAGGILTVYTAINNLLGTNLMKLPKDVQARYDAAVEAGTLQKKVKATSLKAPDKRG